MMLLRSLWRILIHSKVSYRINALSFHPILCLYCIARKNCLMRLIFVFTEEEQDDEEVYKMASIMSSSGGLEAMLDRYFILSYGI